jgi:hypothetical protein
MTTRSLPLVVSLLLTAVLVASPPLSAQSVPFARKTAAGTAEIWRLDEAGGPPQLAFSGVSFLPVELAGAAVSDRLRLDRPTLQGVGEPAPHVRLPGGGSLYRIGWNTDTALLHVDPDGVPSVLLTVGGPLALSTRIGVSIGGTRALVATTLAAGGDVFAVDLAAGTSVCLTAGSVPLAVDDASLRLSSQAAWFVASGVLYRAPLLPPDAAQPVSAAEMGGPVLSELAAATSADCVAAVVGPPDDVRRLVVVPLVGAPVLVTPTPGEYDLPSYADPLGPFLALSPDGELIAYRELIDDTEELFVKDVLLPAPELHVTIEPQFPVYIDNVGILGFSAPKQLCFFAGDNNISGVSGQELMAAADMYMADFSTPAQPVYTNLTQTNGQSVPPFTQPATLTFWQAVLDPLAERFLLVGEDEDGSPTLAAFALDTWAPPGVDTLLASDGSTSFEAVDLQAGGERVLVEVLSGDGDGSDSLTLSMLPPVSYDPAQLVTLATVPESITLDRWTCDHTGEWAACVASLAPGIEIPVYAHLDSGLLVPALFTPFGVSPMLAYSSMGRLYLGLGAAGGPYKFVAFAGPGVGKALSIPVGDGFPLQF